MENEQVVREVSPAGDREGVFVAGVAGHLIPAGDGEGVCLVGVAGMC